MILVLFVYAAAQFDEHDVQHRHRSKYVADPLSETIVWDDKGDRGSMLHKRHVLRPQKPVPSDIFTNLVSILLYYVRLVRRLRSPSAHTAAAVPGMVTDQTLL